MTLEVLNTSGKATGEKVELADTVFGIEPSEHAIWQDVVQIEARWRQGTHKIKERGEVSGSTKKPFKQKGTGNARQGHKRSPLFRHGGTVHGPRPRDYDFKVNKKVKLLARKSALTLKARENKILVVEGVQFAEPKTKTFAEILANLKVATNKILFVLPPLNKPRVEVNGKMVIDPTAMKQYNDQVANVEKAGRNLPKVVITHCHELNTYDIVNADQVVMVKDAVSAVNQHFA